MNSTYIEKYLLTQILEIDQLVIKTIPMQDPYDIEYNPHKKLMYVVSFNSVYVIDTSNTTVVDVISNPAPTQSGIEGIVYNPKKKSLYVIHTGQVFPPSNVFYDTVSVYSTSDNTRITSITLDADYNAMDLVYNPHKKQLYLLHRTVSPTDRRDRVLVITTSDNAIVDTISLRGHNCFDIIYNPRKKQVYVTDGLDKMISIIQASDNTLVGTVPVGNEPDGMAYDPKNKKLYVANHGDNTITVIRTTDNTVIGSIPVGNAPQKIAYNPHKKRIYVTNQAGGTLSVIKTSNDTVIKTIPVGVRPFDIAYSSHTKEMYVTHPSANPGIDGFVSVISKDDL